MRIPDLVYQYANPKDIAGGTLDIVSRELITATAAATITATILNVPLDRIFILTAISGQAIPGAGQNVSSMRVGYTADAALSPPSYEIVVNAAAGAANVTNTAHFSGEIWIPGGAAVFGEGVFNAGVAANTTSFTLHGFLIPRGNVQVSIG